MTYAVGGTTTSTSLQVGANMTRERWESPGYKLADAWYNYVRSGDHRKYLIDSVMATLVGAGVEPADATQAVAVLKNLPEYFPWDTYFPDVPDSFCW